MRIILFFLSVFLSSYLLRAQTLVKSENGLWGYSKEDGTWLIPPKYSDALPFIDGVAYVVYKGQEGYVNLKEEFSTSKEKVTLSIGDLIEIQLKVECERWVQKGKYETTEQYHLRTSDRKMAAKVKELLGEVTAEMVQTELFQKEIKKIRIEDFNADSCIFYLYSPRLKTMFLKVDNISEAKALEDNWEKVQFSNFKFGKSETGKMVVSGLTVNNPANRKQYSWNRVGYREPSITDQRKSIDWDVISVGPSDVDKGIPETKKRNSHIYALVIGNEDYQSKVKYFPERNIPFASMDAEIFKEYCIKTLGVPQKQVNLIINATGNNMEDGINWLGRKAELTGEDVELIVFYSGHAFPDEQGNAYLIPSDLNKNNLNRAIKLDEMYAQLNQYPTKRTTIFIDACYAGRRVEKGLAIDVKPGIPKGNTVAFTSSKGDETSGVYLEKKHGYFTYFLLKALKETGGEINYYDLHKYLYKNVREVSDDDKRQTPEVIPSLNLSDDWKNWKIID